MNYLEAPLDFSHIVYGNKNKTSKGLTIEASIAQHLMIICTLEKGEVFGKPKYGSEIWDLEFNQLVKINKWEERVRDSLLEAFNKHELRLKEIKVNVRLSEIDNEVDSLDVHVRRKAEISASAIITETGTSFNFATLFYISPLSQ